MLLLLMVFIFAENNETQGYREELLKGMHVCMYCTVLCTMSIYCLHTKYLHSHHTSCQDVWTNACSVYRYIQCRITLYKGSRNSGG